MRSQLKIWIVLLIVATVALDACRKRDDDGPGTGGGEDPVQTTPYEFTIPERFPQNANPNPPGNPMTVEGVALGRKLFYEERLSADNTMSCGTCHNQKNAFTDNGNAVSIGIDGIAGRRNSMPIFNLAWADRFFWDGRRESLEKQAIDPVVDPIEMHNTWPNAADAIKNDPVYIDMFKKAFGNEPIDSFTIVKAIAQFERSLVSSDAKIDRFVRGEYKLTFEEDYGRILFGRDRLVNGQGEVIQEGADCFHCHGGPSNLLLTTNEFANNALDAVSTDSGLAEVTGLPNDVGSFKIPSLRNISYSAPYMHDGRFKTLREVIDFYSEGLQPHPHASRDMKWVSIGGVQLEEFQKDALIAFIKTFDDSTFITNPDYSDPDL